MTTCNRILIVVLLIMTSSLAGFATSSEDNSLSRLSDTDRQLLNNAIELVDGGMAESALTDFDRLAKKYPKNYLIQYERLFALYSLHRYDEVIKAQKQILKHKDVEEIAYQLVGNSYDFTGERKKAAEIYNEGLKHFPKSGKLYLELGNLSNLDKDYNKALEYYNKGIIVDPNFASNYFQASMLYLASEMGRPWGLVYAESEILLAPSNNNRHAVMAGKIVDCLRDAITINLDGDSTRVSVKLVPTRNITIDEKTKTTYLAFPGVYEGIISQPLLKMYLEKRPFTASLPQLIELRRGALEAYYSLTDNLYGNGMYLFEFQKKIIDAGHWEAYNYFLFEPVFTEEFDEWYAAHEEEMETFIDWYNQAPYTLGDGRSVDPSQIYSSYRPLELMEATMIHASLLIDTKLRKAKE
ncbi:MAG: hypothetical protein HDS75_01050 [Bacteroidales bacterium]|nr:hypothetical protein [Bacteroidales bacterium]